MHKALYSKVLNFSSNLFCCLAGGSSPFHLIALLCLNYYLYVLASALVRPIFFLYKRYLLLVLNHLISLEEKAMVTLRQLKRITAMEDVDGFIVTVRVPTGKPQKSCRTVLRT